MILDLQVLPELRYIYRKAKCRQQIESAPPVVLGKKSSQIGIRGVERDADCHRFAVADPMIGQLFEFVRRPVSEVQGTRGAELEWIAARRDVIQMQERTAADDLVHCRKMAILECGRLLLDDVEKRAILDERGLHRFGHAGPPI